MKGPLDNNLVSDTPFPSLPDDSSLGMQRICVLLKHNQRLLIPHRLPRDVPHQSALFLPDQSGGPGPDTYQQTPGYNVALNLGPRCV